MFYRLFIGALLLCIVFTNCVFGEQTIVYTPKGIVLTITHLQTKQQNMPSNSLVNCVHIPNIADARFSIDNSSPALQSLFPLLAVPSTGTINIRYTMNGWKSIQLQNPLAILNLFSQSKECKKDIKEFVHVERQGTLREIPVAELTIQPFRYDYQSGKLSIADTIIVHIEFSHVIQNTPNYHINEKESGFLSRIINPQHIPSCIVQYNRKSEKSLNDNWYSANQKYLRLITKKDGIAKISGKEIIRNKPEWLGKELSRFRLIYKGNTYPFGIDKDNDNILSNDDSFFFASKRAAGDTTWFNRVTDESSFFLTLENSPVTDKSARLSIIQTIPFNTIDSIGIVSKHIEEDHSIYAGDKTSAFEFSILSCDFKFGKNFFWQRLSTLSPYSVFTDTLQLTATSTPLSLSIALHGASDIDTLQFDHNVEILWNGNRIATDSFSGMTDKFVSISVPASLVIPGANILQIRSISISDNVFTELYLNYYEISHNTKLLCEQGELAYSNKKDQPISMQIDGLRTSSYTVIDTLNNSYLIDSTQKKGDIISAGIASNGFTSLMFRDSLYFSKIYSGCILWVLMKDGTTHFIQVQTYQDIKNVLNSYSQYTYALLLSSGNLLQSLNQNEKRDLLGTIQTPQSGPFSLLINGGNLQRHIAFGYTSMQEFLPSESGQAYRAYINSQNNFSGYIVDAKAFAETSIENVSSSDLLQENSQADAVFIVHSDFAEQAKILAEHRNKQGWIVKIVDVKDIYKEFNHGIKSVHAIKSFLKHAHEQWKKPAPLYAVLIGNASWDPLKLLNTSNQQDFVPTYGFPVSDVWFSLLDSTQKNPDMVIGRLPVSTPEEATATVNKIIEYDELKASPWMKHFLFLSGGDPDDNTFYNQYDGINEYLTNSNICGDTTRIFRQNALGGVDESISFKIRSAINEGALWVNFIGHGSPLYYELDGWRAPDLNNKGKYFLLSTFSCSSGAFGEPSGPCRNETYLTEANKGSVASLGNTFTGIVSTDYSLFTSLFSIMASNNYVRRIGDLINSAKAGNFGFDILFNNSCLQFNLMGDPMTNLALVDKPDYYIRTSDLSLASSTISANDSIFTLHGICHNRGLGNGKNIPIRIIRSIGSIKDTFKISTDSLCRSSSFSLNIPIGGISGTHMITVHIDPDSVIQEENIKDNNILTIPVNVFANGLSMVDPLPGWTVNAEKPQFRCIIPKNSSAQSLELQLKHINNDSIISQYMGDTDNTLKVYEGYIDWFPSADALQQYIGKDILFNARVLDSLTNQYSKWTSIPIHIEKSASDTVHFSLFNLAAWKESASRQLDINATSSALSISSIKRNITVIGCNAGAGGRYADINYGGRVYIERNDAAKLCVLKISPYDTIGTFREFNAFLSPQDNEQDYRGNSKDLVTFLKDSVQKGDYIAITVSDACFRGPIVTSAGLIGDSRSLIDALKECGSTLIDSVFNAKTYQNGAEISGSDRISSSFVMIGRKGSLPGSAIEKFAPSSDTLTVSDTLTILQKLGNYSSGLIGPAKEWHSLDISTQLSNGNSTILQVYGRNSLIPQDSLLYEGSDNKINLNTIDAKIFPYLTVNILLLNDSSDFSPILNGINCTFIPAPELTVFPSDFSVKGTYPRQNILKGDSLEISGIIKNLSLKQSSFPLTDICISQKPLTGSNSSESYTYQIPLLQKNEAYAFSVILPSQNVSKSTDWTMISDCSLTHEDMYRFNNTVSKQLFIDEDSVSPSIQVYADGILLKDNDTISANPSFSVIVQDNSFLTFDSSKLRVRINRFWQPDSTASKVTFTQYEYGSTQRVSLNFTSLNRLDIGENLLTVFTEDASANKDTVRLLLHVVLNSSVHSLTQWPNPIQLPNSITIGYTYAAQKQDADSRLTIASINGSIINTLYHTTKIGNNQIQWNCKDSDGNLVAPGVYLFRLQINGDSYTEPVFGKMIIIE